MKAGVLLADTSRWACTPRLAIGLRSAGVSVSAVFPTRNHPLLKTRALTQAFSYSSVHPLESLVAAIERAKPQIVIPCDEWAVQHIHELYLRTLALGNPGSEIAALIRRSLGRPESYPVVAARYTLLEIAGEEGLLVPEMTSLRTINDLESWRAGHGFPWVLKADGTFGGRGVKIAHSLEEARQLFSKLTRTYGTARVLRRLIVNQDPFWIRPWWRSTEVRLMAQSYIRGRPANCAAVCWEGKVLAGIGVEVIRSEGPTGPASVVRVVESAEMRNAAERIARRLGLSGFFGLDFMIEEGTGRIYLIEMNPRSTPPCHLQLGTGRDMVAALAAQLLGQPLREAPPITQNDVIVYFPPAGVDRTEFAQSGFYDVPRDEPELVKELLRPWPERTVLARLFNHLHRSASQASDESQQRFIA